MVSYRVGISDSLERQLVSAHLVVVYARRDAVWAGSARTASDEPDVARREWCAGLCGAAADDGPAPQRSTIGRVRTRRSPRQRGEGFICGFSHAGGNALAQR